MTSYFPKAGNLNGRIADICSDMAGLLGSGLGNLLELSDRSNTMYFLLFPPLIALLAAILDLSVTTTTILPFGGVM